jgi:hypothetical protein
MRGTSHLYYRLRCLVICLLLIVSLGARSTTPVSANRTIGVDDSSVCGAPFAHADVAVRLSAPDDYAGDDSDALLQAIEGRAQQMGSRCSVYRATDETIVVLISYDAARRISHAVIEDQLSRKNDTQVIGSSGLGLTIGQRLYPETKPETFVVIASGGETNAFPTVDEEGELVLGLRFTDDSAERLSEYSRDHVGGQLAIVVDGIVVSVSTIAAQITPNGGVVLSGLDPDEVVDLSWSLTLDPYPVELEVVASRNSVAPLPREPAPQVRFDRGARHPEDLPILSLESNDNLDDDPFSMPEATIPGWQVVRVESRESKNVQVQLMRLPSDKTFDDYLYEIDGREDIFPDWYNDILYLPGPGLTDGTRQAETLAYLTPGEWLVHWQSDSRDGWKTLFVASYGSLDSRPPLDNSLVVGFEEYKVHVPEVVSQGERFWKFVVSDRSSHAPCLLSLSAYVTNEQLSSFLHDFTPIPGVRQLSISVYGSATRVSAGQSAGFWVDLTPGVYAMADCGFGIDKRPRIRDGAVAVFTVPEAG